MQQVGPWKSLTSNLINNDKFHSEMMLNLSKLETASYPTASRASELARLACSFCKDFAPADYSWLFPAFSKSLDLAKVAKLLLTYGKRFIIFT
jgi:hypothetical protein